MLPIYSRINTGILRLFLQKNIPGNIREYCAIFMVEKNILRILNGFRASSVAPGPLVATCHFDYLTLFQKTTKNDLNDKKDDYKGLKKKKFPTFSL